MSSLKVISILRRKLSIVLLMLLLSYSIGAASFRTAVISDDERSMRMILDALSVLSGQVTSVSAIEDFNAKEERAAILAVAARHRAGLWVLTLLYTGMRPGETAALTWSDVDFDHNEIHVHAAKESGSRAIKGPKTASGVRDIPIHAALLPRLLEVKGKPFSLVFPTKAGTVQNESSMRRMWNSFISGVEEELGRHAEGLTPYCLRHTFCTDLQRAGVPINVAKELMGHADIQTTANIYTHRDSETLHSGIALLDGTGGKDGGNVKIG